jgi:DNA-directed RNA polymerase subunit D
MELIEKNDNKIKITSTINTSLANAIRRSVAEIPILAIKECDVYRNDSALYDEVIAHRLGLIPLKNQKLKADGTVELKLKAKGKEGGIQILSKELGELVVYEDIPIVLLDKGQDIEIVARAGIGTGVEHAKFIPGLMFYNHLPKIKISKDGESQAELAELYPEIFEFTNKLQVKNASKCQFDNEDFKDYPGIEITHDNNLVIQIESWGQISPKEIFTESCKTLKSNLSNLSKALK